MRSIYPLYGAALLAAVSVQADAKARRDAEEGTEQAVAPPEPEYVSRQQRRYAERQARKRGY